MTKSSGLESGFFFGGAWGFACSSKVHGREMEAVLSKALKIAKASAKAQSGKILFHPAPALVDRYQTALHADPFQISPEAKIDLLLAAEEKMRKNQEGENLRGLHGRL